MGVYDNLNIPYSQYLDHHGQLHETCSDYTSDAKNLINFYKIMLRTRVFDQKAINLQRTGKLGTYASSLGQEAIGVALGAAMHANDVLAPTYRDYAVQLSRGIKMSDLLLYWGGDERGMDYEFSREDLPICVPIATHTCHAVGIAYAMKLRKQPRVMVCIIGDGATSKGDFYEALNAAGVWQLPVIFIINNNQWAISLPRDKQSATKTLAQKAVAAEIYAEQVDGNDVIACYERMHEFIERARTGGGPCLLEAISYRLSDHTTADDAQRYRSPADVEAQWQFDPISRLKTYLLENQFIDAEALDALQKQAEQEVEEQVKIYLNTATQPPEAMFDYLYETLPEALQSQRDEVMRKGKKHE